MTEALTTDEQVSRTDEELAAKLRGQLAAVVDTLRELQGRDLSINCGLRSDDCDEWSSYIIISRTTYL